MIFYPLTRSGAKIYMGANEVAHCCSDEVAEEILTACNSAHNQRTRQDFDRALAEVNTELARQELERDNKALEYDNDYLRSVIKDLEAELKFL
jgi:hypothetical protein